jgi:hypothetical protein
MNTSLYLSTCCCRTSEKNGNMQELDEENEMYFKDCTEDVVSSLYHNNYHTRIQKM